jgi:hypothetical protein
MTYKLILVQAEDDYCECDGYDGCCCDPVLSVKEIGLGTLVQTANYALKQDIINVLMSLVKNGDKEAIAALKSLGWVSLASIEDREKRLVAGKKFYWCEKGNYARMYEFDLESALPYSMKDVAKSNVAIAQEITKTSLKKMMSKEQRAAYDKEVKRLNAEKKKKAEAAAKRKEAKRKKEIEKAKKLLEEEGER